MTPEQLAESKNRRNAEKKAAQERRERLDEEIAQRDRDDGARSSDVLAEFRANPTQPSPTTIDQMNARYAWIESPGAIAALGGDHIEFRKIDAFRTTYSNVKADGKALGTWWLEHADRNSFESIGLFAPPRVAPEGALNLWRGFAVKSQAGDWSKMRAHIRDVIADGDPNLDTYLVRWIAWMFQNPGIRAEAAIVVRGEEGTGKGMLGNALGTIMGRHAVHVTNPEHFVSGRFNAHMAEAIFFFADECHWAGDKKAEGKLKGLITEPTHWIEPKGVNMYETDNSLHVMISANGKWVVPAGDKARRFVVTDVSESKRGDKVYFKALANELANGGLEAMLHDLLAMDLGEWHPREIVDSEALRKQKEETLDFAAELSLAIVRDADLPGIGGHKARPWISSTALTAHAKELIPKADWSAKRLGIAMRSIGASPHKSPQGQRGWNLPTLTEARAAWSKDHHERSWDPRDSW